MSDYMLDTNVFNRLADEQVSLDAFRGLRLVATHVQVDELKATKCPARAAELLRNFETLVQEMRNTASAFWDVSQWDQSNWSGEDDVVEKMLARLKQLDAETSKKHRDPKNPIRDILIADTAIKLKATLISDDENLRRLVHEFGGRAIPVVERPAVQ
jgi:predicted nucleic acid-binding protein